MRLASLLDGAHCCNDDRVRVRYAPDMASTREVVATVEEVLPDMGIAHARGTDGLLYGLNRRTPGVLFDDLGEGMKLWCTVAEPFARVLRTEVVKVER